MKKILLIGFVLILILSSCGNYRNGELVGVTGKQWYTPDPYGMVMVPPGFFGWMKQKLQIQSIANL